MEKRKGKIRRKEMRRECGKKEGWKNKELCRRDGTWRKREWKCVKETTHTYKGSGG